MTPRGSDSRRRVLQFLVVSALVGAVFIEIARRYQPDFLETLCLLVVAPLLALSVSLWRNAGRQTAGGRSLRMAAAFLALSGLALAWSLWRLLALMGPAGEWRGWR